MMSTHEKKMSNKKKKFRNDTKCIFLFGTKRKYLLSFRLNINTDTIKLEINTSFPGVNIEYTAKGRSKWRRVTPETVMPPGTEIEW